MKCKIETCVNDSWALGLCNKHRMQERRKDPLQKKKDTEHTKRWRLNNKEAHAAQQARQHVRHSARDKAYRAQWKKDNKKTYNAYLAARKQKVKQVTPIWADLKAIQQFYFNCQEGYHVDHIIPINGINVTGLHTIDNLQYLLAVENLKKSNKFAA